MQNWLKALLARPKPRTAAGASVAGLVLERLEARDLFTVSPVVLNSWFVSGQGEFSQVISAVSGGTTIGPSTTWTGQNSPVLGDVQKVSYSTSGDFVYVNTPDLASYTMGPWWSDATQQQPFVNFPRNQNSIFRVALNTTYPSNTHTKTPNGPVGIAVNGVAFFGNGDAFSYRHSTAADAGMTGDGIWNRQAEWGESATFDMGNGHQPGSGQYHHHTDPPALRAQLSDNIDYVGTTNFFPYDPAVYLLTNGAGSDGDFVEHTANLHHSPIIGWMFDGYPIYGAYGYADPTDPASAVTRMRSSFSLRTDLTNGSPRISVPGWSAQLDATQLGATAAATAAEAFYTMTAEQQALYAGPAVSATYPLGRYGEDYAYVLGSGELDPFNGRWCVTPEFPSGTYAYFDTIDAAGESAFPYLMGRQYYGVTNGSGKVTSISEPVTIAFDVATNTAPVVRGAAAASVAHGGTLALSGNLQISVTDVDAASTESLTLAVSSGTLSVDLSSGLAAGATISAGANGSSTLTLNGNITLMNAALATLTYTAPSTGATATLTARGNDGSPSNNLSNTLTTTISLLNRAPVVSGPASANAPHGGTVAFTGSGNVYSVSDFDSSNETITISVSGGSLSITPGGTNVTGNGTASVTIAGTLFNINTALETLTYTAPNAGSSETLSIQADDGASSNNLSNTLFTAIELVNGAPSDIQLSPSTIAESEPVGTLVGTFSTSDPDSSVFSYSLVNGLGSTDNSLFTIGGATLVSAAIFNFEAQQSYSIRVRATDELGLFVEKSMVVAVTNVNEAPSITGGPFNFLYFSGLPDNSVIGFVTAIDADAGDLKTFSIESGSPLFAIDSATGVISLTDASSASGSYSLTVRVADSAGLFGNATVIVDEHNPPVIDVAPKVIVELIPAKSFLFNGTPVSTLTANITYMDAGGAKGIAVITAAASASTGQWQFSTDSGATWTDITEVDGGHALLLADEPANRVRFTPNGKFVGFAALTYKAWDMSVGTGSTGTIPSFGDTTSSVAFSTGIEKASVSVGKTTPTIDLSGNALFSSIPRNAKSPAGNQVKSLLGLLASDADRKNTLGVAVTDVDNASGKWQYQVAGKWIDILGVSGVNALLLGPKTKARFLPATDFFGPATFTYHVWDQSVGQVGERAVVTGSSFSSLADTATVRVLARPLLDTTIEQSLASPSSPKSVSALLTGTVTDVLPGMAIGIAVIGATGKGNWTYQIGSAPEVRIKAASTSAVVLPAEAVLQFHAAADFSGRATLSYKAWNATSQPLAAGRKINPSGIGFSIATETLSLYVAPVGGDAVPTIDNATVQLGSITEDPRTNLGVSVRSLVKAAKITDEDPKDKLGIAVVDVDVANGTWQYSLDRKVWHPVPALDANHALALADTASLKFVPSANFNGTATMSFKAWDGTTGSSADLLDPSSGAAFSASVGTEMITISPVNDSPTLDNSSPHYLPAMNEGETSADITVSTLTAQAGDVETAANQIGICIAAAKGPGAWKFSTDGTLFSDVRNFPVLLSPASVLRFVGSPGKLGLATLTYKAWDGSSGSTSPLKANAISATSDRLTVAVGNTPPALSGPGTLPAIKEDSTDNPGDTVFRILGKTFADSPGSAKGIALTSTTVPIAGVWQYRIAGEKNWRAIPAVDESNALLLPDNARVRFVPAKNVFSVGDPDNPAITYKAWDQTVGSGGEMIDTTDVALNSFSASEIAKLNVISVEDAPTLDTSVLQSLNGTATVSALVAGAVTDPESNSFGIAVTGLTGRGTWEYSFDNFATAGTPIASGSTSAALLLPATATIRFVPNQGATGLARLRYKAWDTTSGQSGTANTYLGANKVFFSSAIETLSINIGNVEPILTPL